MRTKTTSKIKETISAGGLAELSNLTARRIYQLAEEKRIPPAVRGRFPTRDAVRRRFEFYQRDGETLQREKMLKTAAERKLREHELSLTDGTLMEVAVAQRTISAALKKYHGIVRTELERLEPKAIGDYHTSLGLSDENKSALQAFHIGLARQTIDKIEETCALIAEGKEPAQLTASTAG
jgi:hypothetical protein